MKFRILTASLSLLALAAARGAPSGQPAPEAKLVAELYGKRIAQAQSTPETKDNVDLARELLLAAADSANPARLRGELALAAVKLTAPTGTDEGAKLARRALEVAESLGRLDPIDRCTLQLQIAQARHAAARKSKTSGREALPLMVDVVQAEIALARAYTKAEKFDQARALLNKARSKARLHRLADQSAEVQEALKELSAARARLLAIKAAIAQLERLQAAGNDEGVKAARRKLGLIYLLTDGDLPRADSYLSGTGEAYEPAVAAAAAFLKNAAKIPPKDKCNGVIESLLQAANAAENEPAKVRIAKAATAICRAYLATNPGGLSATKARLLLVQAERLAGDSPADRFIKKLKQAYKGLSAKLEVLPGGTLRASYDFSKRKQLSDWEVSEGSWQVHPAKQILACAPVRGGSARLVSRLRFRADKPLTLAFRVSGRQALTGLLVLQRYNDPRFGDHEVVCALGGHGNRRSYLHEAGRRGWSDERYTVTPNMIYRFEIVWDGQGGVTWTVNGKELCQYAVQFRGQDFAHSSIRVGLQTRQTTAAFDDVRIEGTVLADPTKRPSRPGGRKP